MDENRDATATGGSGPDDGKTSSPADGNDGTEGTDASSDGPGPESTPETAASDAGSANDGGPTDAATADDDWTDDSLFEGWWRYPPAAWLGLVTAPAGIAVFLVATGVDGVVTSTFLQFVGTALFAGPLLALVLGSLLSFGTVFWGSLRYRDDPDVEWNPRPLVYLVASVFLTPLLVGGVWFLQVVRHVGTPDFGTWI
jgi:hypothetical protein